MPRAAVCPGLNQPLEIRDLELEGPRTGEIKIELSASGVCHSDLSIQNGTLFALFPIVLGHEGAGVVTEVGAGVEGLEPGDHVVVSWVPQCGECFFCRRGHGHLCEAGTLGAVNSALLDGTMRLNDGSQPIHQMACIGTFAEEAVIPAISAVKIPDDIPLDAAALVGCGVLTGVGAALNTADIREGDTVAVLGCGGVGLNVIQGAKLAGAGEIIAIDMLPNKLDLAKQFGATALVNASDSDPVGQVSRLTENRGADVAFEVIGLKATIDQTIAMTRRGGQAVLVGVPRMDVMVEVPAFMGVLLWSKTIRGCWYGSSNVRTDVARLLDHYRNGDLKLDELITRHVALDDVNEAFTALEAGEVARSVIQFG